MKYTSMKDIAVDVEEIAEQAGLYYDEVAMVVESLVKERGRSYEEAVKEVRRAYVKDADYLWDKLNIRVNDKKFVAFVKHYDEPSEFGIDGGRISKLEIRDNGRVVVNYDRGWDIEPETPEQRAAYQMALNAYN